MASPTGYHRILERQLRRLGLSAGQAPDSSQWSKLLGVVSASYHEADADRYTMERSVEISSEEMRALHDGLSRQARHDALTGLPNRLALTEFLEGALADRQSSNDTIAVLFVDLDDFKLINDSLGHSAGDELLKQLAERICGAVREQDVVARLGGDEFVVVCADITDVNAATVLARRIDRELERSFRVWGHDTVVSVSIGIASSTGGRATTDDLLREADMAMYEAKTLGRSRFVIFDDEMRRRIEHRLATENALRHALARGELVLAYQPIVRLSDRRLLGVEALVRWNRPGHGVVMPSAFIAIAEESRLITAIDAWVIATACEQAAAWGYDVSVAVNLSARDLQQPDIVTAVSAALSRTSLPPGRLIMEITETTLVSGDATIAASLARIRVLGVQLAIDDFGTGYSSFANLRQLPAQTLKIDRSFVSKLDEDDDAATAIVTAIVTMGHALGLKVIAEGVERPAQAERLRRLGCDAAQGYLFAAPQAPEALDRILAAGPAEGPFYWRTATADGRGRLVTTGRGRDPSDGK